MGSDVLSVVSSVPHGGWRNYEDVRVAYQATGEAEALTYDVEEYCNPCVPIISDTHSEGVLSIKVRLLSIL